MCCPAPMPKTMLKLLTTACGEARTSPPTCRNRHTRCSFCNASQELSTIGIRRSRVSTMIRIIYTIHLEGDLLELASDHRLCGLARTCSAHLRFATQQVDKRRGLPRVCTPSQDSTEGNKGRSPFLAESIHLPRPGRLWKQIAGCRRRCHDCSSGPARLWCKRYTHRTRLPSSQLAAACS